MNFINNIKYVDFPVVSNPDETIYIDDVVFFNIIQKNFDFGCTYCIFVTYDGNPLTIDGECYDPLLFVYDTLEFSDIQQELVDMVFNCDLLNCYNEKNMDAFPLEYDYDDERNDLDEYSGKPKYCLAFYKSNVD
jgi:hypothetical protein